MSDWTAYSGSVRYFNPRNTNWASAVAPGSEEERKIVFHKVRTKFAQAAEAQDGLQGCQSSPDGKTIGGPVIPRNHVGAVNNRRGTAPADPGVDFSVYSTSCRPSITPLSILVR